MVILKGPFEVLVGLLYGFLLGVISWVLPVPKEHNTDVLRFILLLTAGVVSLFGSQMVSDTFTFICFLNFALIIFPY